MRRGLVKWFLAGGMRWFLAGYAVAPLLIGLLAAIVVAIVERSVTGLLIVPGVAIMWLLSPLGLLVGMLYGISPAGGPWDGRLVYMGLMAGLVVLVRAGLWLEKRNPVPNGGDGTLRVPTARVVTARRAHLFPTATWSRLTGRLATVPWKQLIGPALLVIAGVGFLILGCAGWAAVGAGV
jgi:hypothetical protein